MANSETPHSGIELDSINLSGLNQTKTPDKPQPSGNDKIDPKTFVKNIFMKMVENDSFLSFSSQIQDVNETLGMKYSSANDIADVILKDLALTTKLLQLVNSSFYGHFSSKGITTVSEAMIILGTEEIKLAAASLKIYEFMKGIAHIKVLKDKTIKALQRSIIARQIAIEEGLKDAEAIQISAMLYDFGEYLVALFASPVFINVEILCDDKGISREAASKKHIGISYSELGRFISGKWKLPDSIIYAMNPAVDLDMDKTRLSIGDFHRSICAFTNDLCNISFSVEGDLIGRALVEISDKYQTCLEITPTQSLELLKMSQKKIKTHSKILNGTS